MQMKANHLRWFGVFSILAIVIFSYVDRINVSVLITNQHFLNYLGIAGDRVAQGELMTLFLIGYGIAAFFLSPIYETFLGVRKGLLISIFIWGFFTIISPFAGTVTLFLLFRFFLGASEGPLFSLKTMYVKDEFKVNERGKPNAITSMGVSIGLAIGFPIITFLIYQFDWKMSFYILGLLNLIIGVPLIYFFIRTTKANNTNQNHHTSKLTFQGLGKTMRLIGWLSQNQPSFIALIKPMKHFHMR
ncbi:MFS transporter [Shimazuella alba]|uniref:MFS transporter n=1 Tax=Shimazuella alba TaxID=2690964 RepID=A0A6I4VUF9_9BACL|nr:MFS transporter [Shimazuella alba]MXQ54161.1 MFS transporter [Shimazuella alba]